MGERISARSRFTLRSQLVSLGAASYACPPLEVVLHVATHQIVVLRRLADNLVDVFG